MLNYLRKYPELLQPPTASMLEAMKIIDKSNSLVLVVDGQRRLLGTVVDSDIRKAIIMGAGVDQPLQKVMNPCPTFVSEDCVFQDILDKAKRRFHSWMPVLDENGVVTALYYTKDIVGQAQRYTDSVVILAGGMGTRLRPLTLEKPKPMLPVGGIPMLEIIVKKLIDHNFRRLFLSVNYLASVIKEYFGDGSQLGVEIHYLEEDQPLGTAGPLSLLPGDLDRPFMVTNGDLLTKLNFNHLMNYHTTGNNLATVCVRNQVVKIPYGVVKVNKAAYETIEEKPEMKFLVNCGIYVFDPGALELMERGRYCDMPDFLDRINQAHPGAVACFPITEFWLDVGTMDNYEWACANM